MSTRGIFTFKGYGETHHVFVHHDSYPTGALEKLMAPIAYDKVWMFPRYEPGEFAAGFVAANKTSAGGVRLCQSRHSYADVEYGYIMYPEKQTGKLLLKVTSTDFSGHTNSEKTLWKGYFVQFTEELAKLLEN